MIRLPLSSPLLGVIGAVLLLAAPLQAQPPGQALGQATSNARGSAAYGPMTFYGAQAAEIPLRRVGEVGYGSVSYYTSADSPIFLTSINFPGVYGSYTIGVAARRYNYRSSARLSYYPPAEGFVLRDTTPLVPNRPVVERVTPVNAVSLTIRVPTIDTERYFQGMRMTKTGTVREFVTEALLTNRDYTYDIRAVWDDKNGRPHVSEQHLTFRAGDTIDVDMTPAASEAPPEEMKQPTLRTAPRPIRPQR